MLCDPVVIVPVLTLFISMFMCLLKVHYLGFPFATSLFIFVSVWAWPPSGMIRSRPRWMIQRPRLTDMSWHLMCVAVGQSPRGPFQGVNSQLECQKHGVYTRLSSFSFSPVVSQLEKRAKRKEGFRHGPTEREHWLESRSQNDVCCSNHCLLWSLNNTVAAVNLAGT